MYEYFVYNFTSSIAFGLKTVLFSYFCSRKKYERALQKKITSMKRIGLLSDTHNYWDERFIKHFDCCDEIWHAGDIGSVELAERFAAFKPFRAVHGNIDASGIRSLYPECLRFTEDGVDVLMTHVGGYPGRYEHRIRQLIQASPPQLFVCGHSHILKVIYDKKYNCLVMNPGAAGKYGFHKIRTLLRFTLDAGNIKDLEVIELSD
jgi:putative phosphoesterase